MSNDIVPTAASNRIAERRRLTNVIVALFSLKQSEIFLAHELEETYLARELEGIMRELEGIIRNHRCDSIRERINKGDAMLAAHRSVIADLRAALVPVTTKDIAAEIGDLMLAYPGKDDLTDFVPLLFDHIQVEHPSRLVLAAACHRLRCTKKFRPQISEVLEELAEVTNDFRRIRPSAFSNLEENLDKARAHLAKMETKLIQAPQPQASSGPQTIRADFLRQRHKEKVSAAVATTG